MQQILYLHVFHLFTFLLLQEEESRTVKTGGEEVTIKNITIEDPSGQARVTLWMEVADINVRPGDFVEITDVHVNLYQDTLSTTMRSRVQVSLLVSAEDFLKEYGFKTGISLQT